MTAGALGWGASRHASGGCSCAVYYVNMRISGGLRLGLGTTLALGMVAGGVALSRIPAADAVPVLPGATASASTSASAQSTPADASSTPEPSTTPSHVDYCTRTDAQIQADYPTAVPKDKYGTRNWYEGRVIIAMTQNGVGWEAPCWVR